MRTIHFSLICGMLSKLTHLCLLFILTIVSVEAGENITTIILINGDPVLAEIDKKGEVIKRIIEVPDYFISTRSHERLVQLSIARAKGLSDVKGDIEPLIELACIEDINRISYNFGRLSPGDAGKNLIASNSDERLPGKIYSNPGLPSLDINAIKRIVKREKYFIPERIFS